MPLPRFLSHNLSWKVIAVVSATLVWMALKSGTPSRQRPSSSRTFRQLPVLVLTSAGDRQVIHLDPGTVDVEVSGPPEVLPRLHARDLRPFVDLTSLKEPGPLRLRVSVHTPVGITLDKVRPAQVTGQSLPPPSPES
jgi:YbbR domain-containing protein